MIFGRTRYVDHGDGYLVYPVECSLPDGVLSAVLESLDAAAEKDTSYYCYIPFEGGTALGISGCPKDLGHPRYGIYDGRTNRAFSGMVFFNDDYCAPSVEMLWSIYDRFMDTMWEQTRAETIVIHNGIQITEIDDNIQEKIKCLPRDHAEFIELEGRPMTEEEIERYEKHEDNLDIYIPELEEGLMKIEAIPQNTEDQSIIEFESLNSISLRLSWKEEMHSNIYDQTDVHFSCNGNNSFNSPRPDIIERSLHRMVERNSIPSKDHNGIICERSVYVAKVCTDILVTRGYVTKTIWKSGDDLITIYFDEGLELVPGSHDIFELISDLEDLFLKITATSLQDAGYFDPDEESIIFLEKRCNNDAEDKPSKLSIDVQELLKKDSRNDDTSLKMRTESNSSIS